jgi:hypothetical protein
MTKYLISERSYEPITSDDLQRLLRLARTDIESFFERYPKYRESYHCNEKLVVLAQGAAMHYVDKSTGVKDFDVWFFYPRANGQLPYRRRGTVDFGVSKFGFHPDDSSFDGRRIDVLMRADKNFNHGSPEDCLTDYLNNRATSTAANLADKAVVGLWPSYLAGDVLWPTVKNR